MIQRTSLRRRLARRAMLPFGGLLLTVVALGAAGCGVSQVSYPPSTGTGAGTGTVSAGGPAKGTAVRPCSGPWASVHDVANNVVVVGGTSADVGETPNGGASAVSAHVGDIIQVRLSITSRWALTSASPSLQKLDPQSGQDQQLNVCFWNFKATAAGDATLMYSDAPNCDRGVACPQWIRSVTFTVHVS